MKILCKVIVIGREERTQSEFIGKQNKTKQNTGEFPQAGMS